VREARVLSKNLTVQYQNAVYQIQSKRPSYALRHANVVVCENRHHEITIEYKGKPLPYSVYRPAPRQAQIVSSKQLTMKLDAVTESIKSMKHRKPNTPAPDHPWRRFHIRPETAQPNPTK